MVKLIPAFVVVCLAVELFLTVDAFHLMSCFRGGKKQKSTQTGPRHPRPTGAEIECAEEIESMGEEKVKAEEIAARKAEALKIRSKDSDQITAEERETLLLADVDSLLYQADAEAIAPSDVYQLLVVLKEAGHADHLPYDLDSLLSLHDSSNCAGPIYMDTFAIMYSQIKDSAPLRDYAIDCFQHHLDVCKLENLFEQETSYLKAIGADQWNSIVYPTLGSYLRIEFLQQDRATGERRGEELNWAVSLVEDIWRLNATSQTECANRALRESLVERLIKSKVYYPDLYKLVYAYFVTYLSDCGLEAGFRREMGDNDINTVHSRSSALADHLMGKFWTQIELARDKYKNLFNIEILFALDLVELLVSLRQFNESNCNESYTELINTSIKRSGRRGYNELHDYLRNAATNYSKDCEKNFRQKVEEFEQSNPDKWTALWTSLQKIKELDLEIPASKMVLLEILELADLKRDTYRKSCGAFLEHIGESMMPIILNKKARLDNYNEDIRTIIYYCAGALKRTDDHLLAFFSEFGLETEVNWLL